MTVVQDEGLSLTSHGRRLCLWLQKPRYVFRSAKIAALSLADYSLGHSVLLSSPQQGTQRQGLLLRHARWTGHCAWQRVLVLGGTQQALPSKKSLQAHGFALGRRLLSAYRRLWGWQPPY